MAFYLNQFHCIGNLVADPELKQAGKNKVCKFRIAVNNPHNESALFFYIDVWGKEGEKCMMLKKGSQVFITNASIIPKQYSKNTETGEEITCTTFTVNVDGYCGKIQFGSKSDQDSDSSNKVKNTKSSEKTKQSEDISSDIDQFEQEFEF